MPVVRSGCIAAGALLALGLTAQSTIAAGVGGPLPDDVAAGIDKAAAESQRIATEEGSIYAGLGNRNLAETRQRQAEARGEQALNAAVIAAIARRPDLADAIVARAAADAPQSAGSLAAAARAAFPGLQPQAQTAVSRQGPGNWYGEPPTASTATSAGPIPHYVVQAAPASQVPQSWFNQPALERYAGAPVYPQPPLPPGVAPAPARLAVPTPTPAGESGALSRMPGVASSEPPGIDPFEPVNRAFFGINEIADNFLLRPIAWTYSFAPNFIKVAVRSAVTNLNEPVVAANDLLQLKPNRAGIALGRFVVNSTVGVAGLYDAADPLLGLKAHKADFGQTLHTYGLTPGPYIVLPLLGPSNTRDAIGRAVDVALDPFTYLLNNNLKLARAGVSAISGREVLLKPLDDLRAGSVDYYVALRSSYLQNRAAELARRDGNAALPASDKATDELFNQTQ